MNPRHRKLRARKRQRQQGAALLIVLFVLLMATTTAVYSLSSTQFEVRAAGALHQSMRAKFVAEAAATGVLAFCFKDGALECTSEWNADGNLSGPLRETYALPNWNSEPVYALLPVNFTGTQFPAEVLPNDITLSGINTSGGGIAGTWSPTFLSTLERWEPVKGAGYRLVVSTYGTLNYDANRDNTADDAQGTNELRFAHSTISATRAFLDMSK